MFLTWTLKRNHHRKIQSVASAERSTCKVEVSHSSSGEDSHGYRCSMCESLDMFNEELLFYNPPIEVIRRALQRLFRSEFVGSGYLASVRQLSLDHPLSCTRKLRHQPVDCEANETGECEIPQHWKLCPGFYDVTLVIQFQLDLVNGEGHKILGFKNIGVIHIAKNLKPNLNIGDRQYSTLPLMKKKKSCSYKEMVDEVFIPLSMAEIQDMWLQVNDVIFKTNVAYWKLSHFYFFASAEDRIRISKTGIISPCRTTLVKQSRRSGLASKSNGVPLCCSLIEGRLPSLARISGKREMLVVSASEFLSKLCSKSDTHLYFNSMHVCKGKFGTDECHVTLAIARETDERAEKFCRDQMLSIHLRQNPVLQINQELCLIKVVESLQRLKCRFWIELYVFGSVDLHGIKTKWTTLISE